jgi:RNA polymerase sigma factor (sigma-70 family)
VTVVSGERVRDRDLRAGLVAGDPAALGEIYDETSPLVYGIALRVTGDRAAAEDIAQEIFLGLWEHPERYDPDRASLRTWLCLIARNRAIDWLRRTQARTRATAALALAGLEEPPQDIESAAVSNTVTKAVRAAVQALPEAQRAAVLLAYFHGLTYRQVAAELAIPEGTAKSRLRLALRHLADRLAADGLIDRG